MLISKKQEVSQKTTKNLPDDYSSLLKELKAKIRIAQIKAHLSVNRELIGLYWEIGKTIFEKQEKEKWGGKVIEKLGKDLQKEFPGMAGFSRTNIFRMRAFYLAYEIVPQLVGQFQDLPIFNIPWGHNVVLLEKLKDRETRLWYARKAIQKGWSRFIFSPNQYHCIYFPNIPRIYREYRLKMH